VTGRTRPTWLKASPIEWIHRWVRDELTQVKYYYPEHIAGYEQVRAEGKTAWAEIHGGVGFEDFCSRSFLEAVLPCLDFATPEPNVLVCGCGTGPDACFLAQKGLSRGAPNPATDRRLKPSQS